MVHITNAAFSTLFQVNLDKWPWFIIKTYHLFLSWLCAKHQLVMALLLQRCGPDNDFKLFSYHWPWLWPNGLDLGHDKPSSQIKVWASNVFSLQSNEPHKILNNLCVTLNVTLSQRQKFNLFFFFFLPVCLVKLLWFRVMKHHLGLHNHCAYHIYI